MTGSHYLDLDLDQFPLPLPCPVLDYLGYYFHVHHLNLMSYVLYLENLDDNNQLRSITPREQIHSLYPNFLDHYQKPNSDL